MPTVNYDRNGNITSLQRNGKLTSTYGLMDNLTYTYTGNRLMRVEDGVAGDYDVDFVNRNSGTDDYTYQANGALKSDKNEAINDIIYSTYVNQPIELQLTSSRWIKNSYDGAGRLYKTSYSTGEYWEYLDGLVFKNGAFYQLATPEGRAVYQSVAWSYEYFHTDHLGNTRVAYKANGTALTKTSETSFDPWGIVLKDAGLVNAFQNRFEYQNKEKESTFNLRRIDFGARGYNASIGRFDRVDAHSENYFSISQYNYVANNPVLYTDPDGNDIIISYEDINKKGKLVTHSITYTVGMEARGPESIRQTIQGLNFIAKNGGDFLKDISKSDFFRVNINVDPSAEQSNNATLFDGNGNPMKGNSGKYETGIVFGSSAGFVDENNNTHSPLSGLYHELEHAKLKFDEASVFNKANTIDEKKRASDWMEKRHEWSAGATGIPGYMNNEEYYATQKEAKFQSNYLNEKARPNHRGDPYRTTGVFSRTPLNGVIPKFKPRK